VALREVHRVVRTVVLEACEIHCQFGSQRPVRECHCSGHRVDLEKVKASSAQERKEGSSAEFVGKETGRRLGSGSTGGFPLPPSPSFRPAKMRAKRRREGRLEFKSKKGSFPSLDFKYDKRRPPNASHPAEKPGES
jgi:hypothetical protein